MVEDSFERAAARELDAPMVGWRIHFAVFAMVNLMLAGIWYLTTPDVLFWPIFPIMGWGIGVAAHYMGARVMRRQSGRSR